MRWPRLVKPSDSLSVMDMIDCDSILLQMCHCRMTHIVLVTKSNKDAGCRAVNGAHDGHMSRSFVHVFLINAGLVYPTIFLDDFLNLNGSKHHEGLM